MLKPEPVLVRSRILVIEDEPVYIDYMLMHLPRIPQRLKKQKGIGDFEIQVADSVERAKRLLTEAKTPFDLVVLDLRLPIKEPGDETEDVDNGRKLLKFIKESQKARGVIIVSIYKDYEYVVEGFHGGALDYVAKPFDDETPLQTSVLNALTQLMVEESERILNQRVRDLVAYAEIGLAHSFRLIFYGLVEGVTEAAESIERYARERYGLDKETDPNDTLILKLRGHQKAVARARRDWAGLQSELVGGGKELEVGYVGRMLEDIKESLLPCLAVKRVVFDQTNFDEKPVATFEKDVEVVLREILVGTLSELPDYADYGKEPQIIISFATEDTRAVVRFEDTLDPISEDEMKAINDGQRILPDAKFGRAWGLSVAQHVALRGGGELVVKTERGRNVVSYHIPLNDHA